MAFVGRGSAVSSQRPLRPYNEIEAHTPVLHVIVFWSRWTWQTQSWEASHQYFVNAMWHLLICERDGHRSTRSKIDHICEIHIRKGILLVKTFQWFLGHSRTKVGWLRAWICFKSTVRRGIEINNLLAHAQTDRRIFPNCIAPLSDVKRAKWQPTALWTNHKNPKCDEPVTFENTI